MTPGARIAAAIEILDRILEGEPAEAALTRWGRQARYAGSGDRRAVRDHVYHSLRRRRSHAWIGGAETGRGLLLGSLRESGTDPATLFTGAGHAPPPPTPDETGRPLAEAPDPVRLDCPDWLLPRLEDDLGAEAARAALAALRDRAPVHLRVNEAKTDPNTARAALAADGVETAPHPDIPTALVVTAGARRITSAAAYRDGLVELQDAAAQAAVLRLPLTDGMRVLDYCAGGGGKALAMGARARLDLAAHDADPARMADLPARADRAGLSVRRLQTDELAADGPYDLVLVDAPCSGSGTWRRTPDAKWRLTPDGLARFHHLQVRILGDAARLVRPGGWLAYATCSIITAENAGTVERFLDEKSEWYVTDRLDLLPGPSYDGFHLTLMSGR